jgi:hypothetical protein
MDGLSVAKSSLGKEIVEHVEIQFRLALDRRQIFLDVVENAIHVSQV